SDIQSRLAIEKLSDDGRMHLVADLRRVFLLMDKIDDNHAFEPKFQILKELLEDIIDANEQLDNEYTKQVEDAKKQFDIVKEKRDIKLLNQTLEHFRYLFFDMTYSLHVMHFIIDNYENINPSRWKDPKQARSILSKARDLIIETQGEPPVNELNRILNSLEQLLILSDKEKAISFKLF
ncbi:MAG: hypothetical protein J5846_10275, partial [Desulfovibrio sp.]|nr:hypothetical protein [Desulfovibrio sp.]